MMKDFAKILCLFTLLTGNQLVLAFQQRQQDHQYRILTSSVPLKRFHDERKDVMLNARRGIMPSCKANARLISRAYGAIRLSSLSAKSKTTIHQSSTPMEFPRARRFFPWAANVGVGLNGRDGSVSSPLPQALPPTITHTHSPEPNKTRELAKESNGISKMDVALCTTYFCNMFVVNLSVVTVPALAAAAFTNPAASAAFESSVASMAPLGGALGKVVNGFVVQRFGGRQSSWMYLVALAVLSCSMSVSKSVGSIGLILMAYEFLASIQWTSACTVLDEAHRKDPSKIARGVAILSLSSYCGALAAKTVGAALLGMSGCWRSVTRFGAIIGLVGAFAMYSGISPQRELAPKNSVVDDKDSKPPTNPLSVLKSILTSQLFWMVGIGHALGYIIRGSDRLLVPFLHEATGFSRSLCASLTSSVTLGFVLGLGRGTVFSGMDDIKDKMAMLKRNYVRATASFMGLGACALNVMNGWFQAPYAMAAAISLFSGVAASSISFQFSQIPNLVASSVFAENKAVALSLVDAAGFFVTSQVLTANTRVLRTMGWSASWTFMALFLGIGSTLMMKHIEPVLVTERKRIRALS